MALSMCCSAQIMIVVLFSGLQYWEALIGKVLQALQMMIGLIESTTCGPLACYCCLDLSLAQDNTLVILYIAGVLQNSQLLLSNTQRTFAGFPTHIYMPMDKVIPSDIASRQIAELNYYQWVPLILVFMAFLFKAPNIIWHLLNTKSGINLSKLCEMTDNIHICKPDDRDRQVKDIGKYIDRWLRENRNYYRNCVVRILQKFSNIFFFCFAKHDGYFLTGFYLFVKILYAVNCVGQFFLLNAFLAMDFGGYGFEIISYFHSHGEWKETPRFPRVTLCDFEVRQMQNVQRFTVQCVLPINLFNEKIFAALWFWLFFVSTLTFFNLANWLFYLLFKKKKEVFVQKYLWAANEIQTGFDKKLSRRFTNDYLREDGCFVLRIVGKNSTHVILSDLIQHLWVLFKNSPYKNPSHGHDNVEHDALCTADNSPVLSPNGNNKNNSSQV